MQFRPASGAVARRLCRPEARYVSPENLQAPSNRRPSIRRHSSSMCRISMLLRTRRASIAIAKTYRPASACRGHADQLSPDHDRRRGCRFRPVAGRQLRLAGSGACGAARRWCKDMVSRRDIACFAGTRITSSNTPWINFRIPATSPAASPFTTTSFRSRTFRRLGWTDFARCRSAPPGPNQEGASER